MIDGYFLLNRTFGRVDYILENVNKIKGEGFTKDFSLRSK
jgi:hypothetical protein